MSLLLGLSVCTFFWHLMLQQEPTQYIEPPPPFSVSGTDNESIASFTTSSNNVNYSAPSELQLEGLPKNDFSHLIDLENFEYLINHPTCKEREKTLLVVILVHSAPENFQKRSIIRETWGTKDPRALLFFIIGAVNSSNIQDKIELEDKVHEDVVQGNFRDAYRNMTYKHVMALKWFLYDCPEARYLLKTDDDVFVNTPLLYNNLGSPTEAISQQFPSERLLLCYEISSAKVKRSYRSKWRVSFDEFSDKYYPNHCPGFSILYSADVVKQLYMKAQQLKYFWIDDVHITGNVASKLNLTISPSSGLFLNRYEQQDLLLGRQRTASAATFLFAQPNLNEQEIRTLWDLVR
jgi:Galactosyltransferase